VAGAWGLERGALWALDLPAGGRGAAGPGGARFGELGPDGDAGLAATMGVPPAEVAARRARGCRVIAAWQDGELAGCCWLSTRREHVGELARTFVLPAGETYVWDCATVERFRGRGLYTALLREIVALLAGEGSRRVWIGAATTNRASNRAFEAAGFRPVLGVSSLRLAGRGLLFGFRPDPEAPPALVAAARGVVTGRQADGTI
jgi:ribosomal protein S18 acetylase RimI-like enzyme